jgi:hypothetical protein
MGDMGIWLVVAMVAVLPATLCWKGCFWTAGLISFIWIGIAIWAWNSSTDMRHPDYSLAAEGGDPRMIFAIGTVLYGLPIYLLGAVFGCALHFRHRIK